MFRSLVRLQSQFGNTPHLSKVCPRSQHFQFALKYSTATSGKRSKPVRMKSLSAAAMLLHSLTLLCECWLVWCFLLFPERKRFYQDVSISQGESKCQSINWINLKRETCSPLWKLSLLAVFVGNKCTFNVYDNRDNGRTGYSFSMSVVRLLNEYFQCLNCHAGGSYEVNLDRRKLKTPGGKLFTVPNEALAIAVATEWDAQRDTLKFYSMHLVRTDRKIYRLCYE